ncbi:MAG: hypothetical protein EXR71_03555 [Myxococcales bacterium]|nr:hypothetical protein [Myxococcales bacterium]
MLVLTILAQAAAGELLIGPGTVVVVSDVGGADPNAMERGALLGEVCVVGTPALYSGGDGWWRGRLHCANHVTYNVTGIAVGIPGAAVLPPAFSGETLAGQLGKTIKFDVPAPPPGVPVGASSPAPVIVASPAVAPEAALRRAAVAGEAVRILAISPEDAFHGEAASIIGRNCHPTEPMRYHADGWQGGPMTCWDGQGYYFYKAALGEDPSHADLELPLEPPADDGPALPAPSTPSESGPRAGALREGRRVKILEVSSDDAFFSESGALVGRRCRVTGDLHPQGDGVWFEGGLTCGIRYLYLTKVRVDLL